MLKTYELVEILDGLLNDFTAPEWKKLIQVDSKLVASNKLIVNFGENCSEYGLSDNKYLIEITHIDKDDKLYDEIISWE